MADSTQTATRGVNEPAGIVATPSAAPIGAEVHGVDLRESLGNEAFARIRALFDRHAVIVLRGQCISPEALAAFSARFGELEVHHLTEHVLPHLPQVRVLSNVKKAGRGIGMTRGGMHWHSDLSYKRVPASATLLYGIECPPEGADTQFADMCTAYETLPEDIRARIRGRRAVHDRNYRYSALYPDRPAFTPEQLAKVPPVEHPVVRLHPATGRKALFIARDLVSGIVGIDGAEGRNLIETMETIATRPQLVYSHRWQVGDVLIWDNSRLLHRATPYDNRFNRTLYRTQVAGTVPVPV